MMKKLIAILVLALLLTPVAMMEDAPTLAPDSPEGVMQAAADSDDQPVFSDAVDQGVAEITLELGGDDSDQQSSGPDQANIEDAENPDAPEQANIEDAENPDAPEESNGTEEEPPASAENAVSAVGEPTIPASNDEEVSAVDQNAESVSVEAVYAAAEPIPMLLEALNDTSNKKSLTEDMITLPTEPKPSP